MSKGAIIKFAETMLRLYPPYRWDEDHEKSWVETLIRELGGFSADVIERAGREIVRTRKRKETPLVADCIDACLEAKRWIDGQKRADSLPTLTNVSDRDGEYSEGRQQLVYGTLLKTKMAKEAAREGWISILTAYCFRHGKLPTDAAEITRIKRDAKEIENWHGSGNHMDPVIAKAKIALMERRQSLAKRVLEEK